MPIIQIKSLPSKKAMDQSEILKTIGEKVSKASNIPLNRLVIYWDFIKPKSYMFNGEFAEFIEEDSHQPVVYISCFEDKTKEQEEAIIRTIAEVLSEKLSINIENVAIVLNRLHPGELFVKGDFVV